MNHNQLADQIANGILYGDQGLALINSERRMIVEALRAFSAAKRAPTVITDFPGKAVEEYRQTHDGMLPSEPEPYSARLQQEMISLREALEALYLHDAEYIRINNLGDVHHNAVMHNAAAALWGDTKPAKKTPSEGQHAEDAAANHQASVSDGRAGAVGSGDDPGHALPAPASNIIRKIVADYVYATPPHLRDCDVLADRIVAAISAAV